MLELNAYDIIDTKAKGGILSKQQLTFIIKGYLSGKISDAQLGAFLMAVRQQGLDPDEIFFLTDAMRQEGDRLDFGNIAAPKGDKHSTGGVGDGTTLCIVPIVSSLGLVVPTMAGRSLGHTGGTIDKLEAIPGLRTALSPKEILKQVSEIGCAIFAQTKKIAIADKKLYAIRDQIACVEPFGLIVSSILSKKLVEGIDSLVLDVKVGSGAFLQDFQQARDFSRVFKITAEKAGLKVTIFITDMDQPLGKNIGNALEVEQAIEILSGKTDELTEDIRELIFSIAEEMLMLGGVYNSAGAARKGIADSISGGRALSKFKDIIKAQGGDESVVDDPGKLPRAKNTIEVVTETDGYIHNIDAYKVARVFMLLAGGRTGTSEGADLSAGIVMNRKYGYFVKSGDLLGRLVHNMQPDDARLAQAKKEFQEAFSIGNSRTKEINLIKEIINNEQ